MFAIACLLEFLALASASILCNRASRVKMTAGRRIRWAGHLPGQNYPPRPPMFKMQPLEQLRITVYPEQPFSAARKDA